MIDPTSPEAPRAAGPLDRIRIVLVDTSHPGNIGSAARAMKAMGLSKLMLVNPRYENPHQASEALALATGAADILAAVQIFATLDEALAGTTFAVALSARQRDLSPPVLELADAAAQCVTRAGNDEQVAFVFGGERYGLANVDVLRCQAITSIKTSASYSSLNLSQAVQIVTYECQQCDSTKNAKELSFEPLASAEDRERMFAHLEKVLIEIDFIDAAEPKRLMLRLRRMFARTTLEAEEVAILRGICTQILSVRTPK
jgi:tRNA/rRNA methyltransferase